MTSLSTTTMESPVGPLTLVASEHGLRAVLWDREAGSTRVRLVGDAGTDPDHPVLRQAVRELHEYFAGRRQDFEIPLDVVGTDFQRAAWEALRTIPFGATASYAEQARRIGKPSAVRAVGAANGRNPVSIVVPCHRVVGADGSLTGFAAGVDTKAWLLDHERNVLARS